MPRISFYGAAQVVTGSCHLIDTGDARILVDCGAFQGSHELSDRNYDPFPFDVRSIDAVVITHAHQDHIGRLPKLVKQGYRGPIYATKATIGLSRISLPDSARIHEEDARNARKHGSRHANPEPLFTEEDAFAALKQMEPVPYHEWHNLPGKAVFRYHYAGHILGSAFAEFTFADGDRILMSGDLGRYNTPVIRDPEIIEAAEYLVIESTYGDRVHSGEDPKDKLELLIRYVMGTGGVLMIPSFSIGRTQEVLYYLRQLQLRDRIPRIPTFVDSPMAISATNLYQSSREEHDEEMKVSIQEGHSEIEPEGLEYVRDRENSKALNSRRGPMIIIAGSGMMNGGRIQHHVIHRIEDPANAILFTGYQAEGTLGRRILERRSPVIMHRQEFQINARVDAVNSLSAHADQHEMMQWLRGFKRPPRRTFIVHGEPPAQQALAARIRAELNWELEIPAFGDSFDISR